MTAPSYTTDLSDVTTAESITSWTELSGHTGGGSPTQESDYFIQGSYCVSQSTGVKTGTACGLEFDYGSNVTISAGDCFFFWIMWLAPNAVDTISNGGLRVGVGSSSGNMDFWNVGGSDFGRFPYGGWQNFAVDPTYTADYTDGSPTGSYRMFGSLPNITSAVSKGNPHGVDAIRYGRGEIKIEYGDGTNGYGTFDGIATQNDSQSNRWGLFQEQAGAYLWKGLLSFGNSTNACDFRDSNVSILIDSTPRTYSTFNKIEINNSSSRVDWTGVSFVVVDTSQLSRGILQVVDNADVNFDCCSFIGMDTFTFLSNSSVTNCTFQGCNEVDSGGGDFTGSKFITPTVAADSYAVKWNSSTSPTNYLSDTYYEMGTNSHHAIYFGTSSPTDITLDGLTCAGFSSSNGQNDSTFYIARTSGTVNITITNGTGNFTYKSAGATVNLSVNQVTLNIHVEDSNGSPIQYARVGIYKESDGTQLMNEETNGNGDAVEAYTYTSDTDIKVRVRKSSASSDRYVPYSTVGTITSSGYSLTVILTEDPNI